MQDVGRLLFVLGLIVSVVGLFYWKLGDRIRLGRLPGDIHVDRPGISFHFPIVTCILVSLLVSLVFRFFRQ